MDNLPKAPIIPEGTSNHGGAAYNSLQASHQALGTQQIGQAQSQPTENKLESDSSQGEQLAQQAPSNETSAFDELASKKGFKDANDLAKSYMELESRNTRVEMGVNELVNARSNDSAVEGEESNDVANAKSEEDALKIVEKIVKKTTKPLEDKIALQNLFMSSPDAKQYASKMADVVKRSPGVSWEDAYKLSKFDDVQSQSTQNAQQVANQQVETKKSLQVGTQNAGVSNQRPLAELIKDKNVPFAEVQRIMREQSNS